MASVRGLAPKPRGPKTAPFQRAAKKVLERVLTRSVASVMVSFEFGSREIEEATVTFGEEPFKINCGGMDAFSESAGEAEGRKTKSCKASTTLHVLW